MAAGNGKTELLLQSRPTYIRQISIKARFFASIFYPSFTLFIKNTTIILLKTISRNRTFQEYFSLYIYSKIIEYIIISISFTKIILDLKVFCTIVYYTII